MLYAKGQRSTVANHLTLLAQSKSPLNFQFRRGEGTRLDSSNANRAFSLQRTTLVTSWVLALSMWFELKGQFSYTFLERDIRDIRVWDAESFLSDEKTIAYSWRVLSLQGEAKLHAWKAPWLGRAPCLGDRLGTQILISKDTQHLIKKKKRGGWLIPKGRKGGGLSVRELLWHKTCSKRDSLGPYLLQAWRRSPHS